MASETVASKLEELVRENRTLKEERDHYKRRCVEAARAKWWALTNAKSGIMMIRSQMA